MDDGFQVQRPTTLGHLRSSFALTLDYARSPLEIESNGEEAGNDIEDEDGFPDHVTVGESTIELPLRSASPSTATRSAQRAVGPFAPSLE